MHVVTHARRWLRSTVAPRAIGSGCVLALLASAPASAQPQGQGTQGTGAGPNVPQRRIVTNPLAIDPNGPQVLVLTIGGFGSYDRNTLSGLTTSSTSGTTTGSTTVPTTDPTTDPTIDPAGTSAPVFWRTGFTGGANVGLDFNKSWNLGLRSSINSAAFSNMNFFSRRSQPMVGAGFGFSESFPLGDRLSVSASQAVRFQPFFGLGLFPGFNGASGAIDTSDALDPTLINAISPTNMFSASVNSSVSYLVSRRGSIYGGYFRNMNYFPGGGMSRFSDHQATGGYSHQINRFLSARLGYGYGRSNFVAVTSGAPPARHTIDIGIDSGLGRGFSLARGLTFGFRTGMGVLSNAQSQSAQGVRYSLQVTGNAFMRQNLGRSWSATLTYQRGWSAIVGFANPFFLDGVTASLGGSLTANVTAGVSASYVNGSVGTLGGANNRSFNGNATVRYRPTPWLNTYAQLVYFGLTMPDDLPLPENFPSSLRRQSTRVGLSIQVPLL